MNLVNNDDVKKVTYLKANSAAKLLMHMLKLNKVNKVYLVNSHKQGIDFIDSVLDSLEVKYEISDEDLSKIPKEGAFITISNHPFGGIDGILLIKLLSDIRPDFKMTANLLLSKIDPLKQYIIPVNSFDNYNDINMSLGGVNSALSHLKEGLSLGVFPAGEASAYNSDQRVISDKQWEQSSLRFIKRAEVPVIPIYFQGNNSKISHLLGMIHPKLRTAKLPSELFSKKNRVVKIRIGNPISVKEQSLFADMPRFGRFLRANTYALGTSLEVNSFFKNSLKKASKKVEQLIDPVPVDVLLQEVKTLDEHLLFTSQNLSVYCPPSLVMPNILNEIGRLREETFRDVGEGTNRSIDIDEFDLYYNQLFIWDNDANKIVGAYRAGKGDEIREQYGKWGFYIQSLFKIKKDFLPILDESIELGRSFIVKEYQKKPLPLFLLWKGILYFVLKNPEYRYLIGPVSISNRFSVFSKDMIIKFIKANFYNEEFAENVKPRKKYKVKSKVDTDILLEKTKDDVNKLDKMIREFEVSDYRMPVLLKKYLKLNAKIIGFNIDPKFNDALDGLMVLDIYDVPMNTIESLSKEINDDSILDRFNIPDPDKEFINKIP